MTSEEQVKREFPNSFALSYDEGKYWVIMNFQCSIGEGKTEGKAWADALRRIKERKVKP